MLRHVMQYCIVLVVVIGGELIGSATVFSFTYVGKVYRPLSWYIKIKVPLCCRIMQLESAMGHRLSDDVMAFGNKDNSSAHMYRINKLQSKVHCLMVH